MQEGGLKIRKSRKMPHWVSTRLNASFLLQASSQLENQELGASDSRHSAGNKVSKKRLLGASATPDPGTTAGDASDFGV